MLGIVFLEMRLVWLAHLHGDEFEAAGFHPQDQLVDQASLHSIGLQHEEGLLTLCA